MPVVALIKRTIYAVVILTSVCLLGFSCKKADFHPGGNGKPDSTALLDYTPIPASTPVNTAVSLYLDSSGGWTDLNPPNFDQVSSSLVNGIYMVDPTTMDLYNSRLEIFSYEVIYLYTYRTVQMTPSLRNYIGIHPVHLIFDDYNTPQYFSPAKDYAAAYLPTPILDSAGKRWFLRSFAAAYTQITRQVEGSPYGILKLPIADALVNSAPDTIPTWRYDNTYNVYIWKRDGYAIKNGQFYEKRFYKAGLWNFATTEPGVYLTLHVRADSSSTVTNTRVVLSNNNIPVAEGRTDADGNIICFVPSHVPLIADLYETPILNTQKVFTAYLASVDHKDERSIIVDRKNSIYFASLAGNVYTCDGTPLAKGVATISYNGRGWEDLYVPIKDGHFSTSIWMYGIHNGITINITNADNNQQGDPTGIFLINPGSMYTANFYACRNSSQLYCNYTVDGIPYSLRDDANSSSPYMTANIADPVSITIKTSSKGRGVDLTVNSSSLGIWSSVISNLKVNDVSYAADDSKTSEIAFFRYDANINGFIEGWFSVWYKDAAGAPHRVEANFKVQKNF